MKEINYCLSIYITNIKILFINILHNNYKIRLFTPYHTTNAFTWRKQVSLHKIQITFSWYSNLLECDLCILSSFLEVVLYLVL